MSRGSSLRCTAVMRHDSVIGSGDAVRMGLLMVEGYTMMRYARVIEREDSEVSAGNAMCYEGVLQRHG